MTIIKHPPEIGLFINIQIVSPFSGFKQQLKKAIKEHSFVKTTRADSNDNILLILHTAQGALWQIIEGAQKTTR